MRGLVETFDPAEAIRLKADADMKHRLTPEGLPHNRQNDYERHLYARGLRLQGKTRGEVKEALIALGLEDISVNKRESYVEDIIRSIIVGY